MALSGAAHAEHSSGLRGMVANLTAGLRRVTEPKWAGAPSAVGTGVAAESVQVAPGSIDSHPGSSTAELMLDATAFQSALADNVPLELAGPVFVVTTTAGLSAERTSVEQTVQALTRHLEEASSRQSVGWLIMTPDGSSYSGQVDTSKIAQDAELYLAGLSEHVERLNAAMIRDHIHAMQGHLRSVDETRLIP